MLCRLCLTLLIYLLQRILLSILEESEKACYPCRCGQLSGAEQPEEEGRRGEGVEGEEVPRVDTKDIGDDEAQAELAEGARGEEDAQAQDQEEASILCSCPDQGAVR